MWFRAENKNASPTLSANLKLEKATRVESLGAQTTKAWTGEETEEKTGSTVTDQLCPIKNVTPMIVSHLSGTSLLFHGAKCQESYPREVPPHETYEVEQFFPLIIHSCLLY